MLASPSLRTIIVRDASACPAGEPYLTWDQFAALGRERLAAAPELVTGRLAAITPQDPVTLLYTSGTTGSPKGVLLTHHCILYEVAAALWGGTVVALGLLPAPGAHRRADVQHLPAAQHGRARELLPGRAAAVKTVGEVRPTAFFGVPRVWEKIRAGIQALLAAEPDPDRRAAVERPWTSAAGTWKAPSTAGPRLRARRGLRPGR